MSRMLLALVVAFALGAAVAAVLVTSRGGGGIDEAPSEPVFTPTAATQAGTATAAATAAQTPPALELREPQLSVGQVIGMRGCDQPIFIAGGGVPPRTRVLVERADNGQAIAFTTSDGGFVALDGRPLFASDCEAGVRYMLRLLEESSGGELASTAFEVPVFPGTIEVKPASGGCSEIVVTVRGMPAGRAVNLLMAEVAPFAQNFAQVVQPLLQADDEGFARSEPFRPPWSCASTAVSLFAAAGATGKPQPVHAELLYRIALGADEPVPSVERWLDAMGR